MIMSKPFSPKKPLSKSSSYDKDLGEVARKRWPLNPKSKPKRRVKDETVTDGEAWDAWVWHPEARPKREKRKSFVGPPRGDWLEHGSSRYPGKNKFGKRGQILKHPKHNTYWKTVLGEASVGNAITYDKKTNHNYSNPAWWLGGRKKDK